MIRVLKNKLSNMFSFRYKLISDADLTDIIPNCYLQQKQKQLANSISHYFCFQPKLSHINIEFIEHKHAEQKHVVCDKIHGKQKRNISKEKKVSKINMARAINLRANI